MGRYVGRLIAARDAGGPLPPPFRYRHLGDLATIGRHAAVVKLGRPELTGFLGWLFWSVVPGYRRRRLRLPVVLQDHSGPHSRRTQSASAAKKLIPARWPPGRARLGRKRGGRAASVSGFTLASSSPPKNVFL
jgi:hypothetical protein